MVTVEDIAKMTKDLLKRWENVGDRKIIGCSVIRRLAVLNRCACMRACMHGIL